MDHINEVTIMTSTRSLLSVFAMVLLLSGQVLGVTSTVVDPDGKPIEAVSIVTDDERVSAVSDSVGVFTLDNYENVSRVTFSHIAFQARQMRLHDIGDRVILQPLYIRGTDIIVHASRAEQGVTPVSFDNISREDIGRDFTVAEFPMLLQTTPNAYVYSDAGGALGYTYVRIRGFDDRRVVTYINGVPLNDPEDQITYFIDLPDFAANVSDIQVQRGVGNSLYGDASFGGTINVVTSILSQPQSAMLTAGFGSYTADGNTVGDIYKQSLQFSSGLIDGRWAFGGRFSKQRSDGYRRQSWYDGWSYYFSLARLDPNMTTELYLFGGPMKVHAAWYGASREELALDRRTNVGIPGYEDLTYGNAIDNFSQPHYQLHNRYRLGDRATLTNTLYYIGGRGYYEQYKPQQTLSDYSIPVAVTDGSEAADLVRQKQVQKRQIGWNTRLDLEHDRGGHAIGGSFYHFRSDHFGQVVWAQHLTGNLDPQHKYYHHYGRKYLLSFFAQERYRLSERLTTELTAQLRYQNYEFLQIAMGPYVGHAFEVDWLLFSPRLGFSYTLDEHTSLYTNFSISQRTPSDAAVYDADDPSPGVRPLLEIVDSSLVAPGRYSYEFGEPTVKSEKLYDFELGGEYRQSQYAIGANLYWMYFADMIVGEGGVTDGIEHTLNVDAVIHAGLELTGACKPVENLTITGNFAYNFNRIRDYVHRMDYEFNVPDPDGNPLTISRTEFVDLGGKHTPRFPEYLGNIIADFQREKMRLTWRGRFIGRQYADLLNIDGLSIDPAFVASLSTSYEVGRIAGLRRLTITGQIDNLFDHKYEAAVAYAEDYAWRESEEAAAVDGWATYFVAPERSFYVQLQLELF
ncbi:MAG: TonB-dependent receptor [bacterium]